MKNATLLALLLLSVAACQRGPATTPEASALLRTEAADGAKVYIISPADSARVTGPRVLIQFGLVGMGIAPAGVDYPLTGHHHLLVDVSETPPENLPIPSDENHLHFGMGQTEAAVELSPGRHTLQLLLGDRNHIPHVPPVISEKIAVIVE